MGRIRTIKPEFPQSETVGALSRDARLLFIQLWTIADDHGRARANSRMLASLLYPYDDDAPDLMDTWLSELERQGCIRRYEVDGAHYLDIPKWSAHQKVDHASAPKFPDYREDYAATRDGSRGLAQSSSRTKDQGEDQGREKCRKAHSRISYSPRYETFWETYPTDKGMSKLEAYTEWEKLPPEDQETAIAVMPAFKVFLKTMPADYRIIHACRFLKKRRFDAFAEDAAKLAKAEETASTRVYVKYGTEPGDAWETHYRTVLQKPPPRDSAGGWWHPSEFPENVKRETIPAAA